MKEKEILQIQERLQKALKTLHFLRYVIITDFYNHKQCQIPQTVETNKQTRIHPAVKSLLGKSPKFATITEPAVPSTSTDSRFLSTNDTFASGTSTATDGTSKDKEDTNEQDVKLQIGKRKLSSEELQPRKIPRYVPPKIKAPSNTCPSRGERYKMCKRIIVGNISKWIPPDWREDAASHKWTMYVRGDKNEANISAFVNKVRFFLHPSYRPNDVVEVTSYPFHLSRRGWGEFPLRVQLHFKNAMNKPIDIIHHLKLDRTYTGLQTLGSETLVDLWIHAIDSRNRDQNISNECAESSINKMSEEIRSNNDSNSELICKQPAKCTEMTEHLKSQFTASSSVEAHLKEEIASLEMSKPSSSIDFMLSEEPADIKIKIEPNNTIMDSSISFSTDLHKTGILEKMRVCINREHDYSSKQYSSSHCRTVKEGNVTIEHFPEKECSFISVTDLSTVNGNKETSNTITITSHECNGDIRSSNDCKSSTVSNTSDTMGDNTQVTSKHTVFQKHNNRKSLSSDLSKPLRNTESSSVSSRISEKPAENTTTMINGFCKPFNVSLDLLHNLQKAPNSSDTSHLEPLEISIPPLFAPSTSKRILLMKDKKLIPVEVRKRLADDNAKVPITSNIAKFDLSHSVSILKKPLTSNIKANVQSRGTVIGNKKEATVFTMRDTNSLLLNVDYDIPALKIADSRDLQYGYGDVTRNNVLPIGRQELPCTKSEDKDEKVIQRTKITLGKDRYRIQSKKEAYETVLRTIENANIADTEAFVRFVIRRLPIVTRDAHDLEYRRLHPYTCCSEEDFFMCNVGKQRALEWYRAKMVRHIMQKKSIPDDKLWSIREIMVWARLHGYTPSRDTFGMPDVGAASDTKRLPDSSAFTAVLNTCTEPVAFQNWLQICQQDSSHRSTDIRVEAKETEIDIESIDESPCIQMTDRRENGDNNEDSKSLTLTPLELDESLVPLHNFVCENARDIGIKIGPEEIVPGVMYCAASRAIMRVRMIFLCFRILDNSD